MQICGIVDDDDPIGSLVVDFAQRFVALLSGGVPKGHLYAPVSHLYHFFEEFDADGGVAVLVELVVDVSKRDVCLARADGADEDYLEGFAVVHGACKN